jgi:hypothetical protein
MKSCRLPSLRAVPVLPADSCQSIAITCKKVSDEPSACGCVEVSYPTRMEKLLHLRAGPQNVAYALVSSVFTAKK